MEIITTTIPSYERWLDDTNQSFYQNLDAELDAMAAYYLQEDDYV